MAKYSIEISSMLSAYAHMVKIYKNPREVIIRSAEYNCTRSPLVDYKDADFKYNDLTSPNGLVEVYGARFIRDGCPHIIENFTTDQKLNDEIIDQFFKTFVRHFYPFEIGQENPLLWWDLMQAYLDEFLPFFVLSYQQLIINNQAFITGLNDSDTTTTSSGNVKGNGGESSIAGTADTPQDELNFKLNTGDPAQDYNFKYSSAVNGAKGASTSTTDTTSNSDTKNHSEGRNQTVMALINQLNTFSNGIYLEMFQQAKTFGLFSGILS